MPDNQEDYSSSSSDCDQDKSSLAQVPMQVCKKCRVRISAAGESVAHTCMKHRNKRIIPESNEDNNDDHNIAIMEEPEEMKVQLIGNIHYNLNRGQN